MVMENVDLTLLRLLGPSEPELGCDECFAELDRYVELELGGAEAAAPRPRIAGRTTPARCTSGTGSCSPRADGRARFRTPRASSTTARSTTTAGSAPRRARARASS